VNLKFKKSSLIKIALILGLLALAPYLVPFTLEFIIVADLMGLEALIVFLFAYGKSTINSVQVRLVQFKSHIAQTALLVAELYMFKPSILLGHATVSGMAIVLACSVMLACAVWLPVMLMSAGSMM
jgi:hypothetical protein